MPLIRTAADAFGVVTVCLVFSFALLGLLCIYRSFHFQLQVRKRGFLQLRYFNGPWFTRIVLIFIAIWWCFGEIAKLTLLKGKGRLFPDIKWQKCICKFYILSNLGLAEPGMFLMLVLLLHASLQKRESGVLSHRWNRKTVSYFLFYTLPVFAMQLVLVVFGPRYVEQRRYQNTKFARFFTSSSLNEHIRICTYPFVSTMILGLFHASIICYICYLGTKVVSLVINKGLRRRVYSLVMSIIVLLPLRVLLLGLSVLPHGGHLLFEAMVFIAFLSLLFCIVLGICVLVYFPVSDSLALGDLGCRVMVDMPYDDYYSDGVLLINVNRSHHREASLPPATIGEDANFFSSNTLHIVTPSGPSNRPMFPLGTFLST